MGKKSKDSSQKSSDAVQSLFAADNPFRRKAQSASPASPPPHPLGLAWDAATGEHENTGDGSANAGEARKRKRERGEAPTPGSASVSIPKRRKKLADDGEEGSVKKKRKKRKRDELEEEYEKRTYGVVEKMSEDEDEKGGVVAVGEKRKADDVSSDMVALKESFDDETKLVRTVFVGNLPLRTKRKSLLKEFERFGEVESVRIRSVPIVDVSNEYCFCFCFSFCLNVPGIGFSFLYGMKYKMFVRCFVCFFLVVYVDQSKVPRKAAIIKGKINDAVDRLVLLFFLRSSLFYGERFCFFPDQGKVMEQS